MMKYKRWHDAIVDRARHRTLDGFCEWHHLIPRALGGSDEPSNLVALTYREHFLVHWLLTKLTSGRDRSLMAYALHCMGMTRPECAIAGWQVALAKRTLRLDYLQRARVRAEGRKLAWKDYLRDVQRGAEDAVSQLRGINPAKSRDRGRLKALAKQYLKADQRSLDQRRSRGEAANQRANRIIAEAKKSGLRS